MTAVRLDLRIAPTVIEAMRELVGSVLESLHKSDPVQAPELIDDAELREAWEQELNTLTRGEAAGLLRLLEHEAFGREAVQVSEGDAEALVRAASALRLRVRSTLLHDIADESLEAGDLDLMALSLDQQRGMACYLFLGTLQAVIVHALDPESGENPLPDDGEEEEDDSDPEKE